MVDGRMPGMDKYATTLHALLTGIGSTFVLVPLQPERGRHE